MMYYIDFLCRWQQSLEDEDDMLPWEVDDHCDDGISLLEFARALHGMRLKLVCRDKEQGTS